MPPKIPTPPQELRGIAKIIEEYVADPTHQVVVAVVVNTTTGKYHYACKGNSNMSAENFQRLLTEVGGHLAGVVEKQEQEPPLLN